VGSDKVIGQGLVSTIWVDPDNHDTILIGGSNAGLWKTTNGGTNWTCKTEGIMTGGIKDIAVHPTNKDIIYIVTQVRINNAMQFNSIGQYSLGIFKSTDGAETWTRLNTETIPDEEYFSKVLVNPTNPNILYALTINEVYKSENAGGTWASTNIGYTGELTYGLTEMEFKPGNPEAIYVSGGNALYRTTNGGDTWTSLLSGLTNLTGDAYIALAVDNNNQNDLYAFYLQNGVEKLEKSTNSGDNFTWIGNPGNVYAQSYVIKIWIAPDGDIFAGGVWISRSRDGGSTFTVLNSNKIHDDKRDCSFPNPSNGNLIYLATDGGVYMDTDDGDSWEDITGDLPINEFVSLDITTQDPEIMLGGTMDCGTYMRNNDGSWTFKWGGDGGRSLLDQSNYNIYYYTGGGSYFYRVEWSRRDPLFDLAFYDTPIIMDPIASETLYRSMWTSEPGQPPVTLYLKIKYNVVTD
jgi:photosystem II stability/assembly factor-like uncharacterized protein